MVKTFSAILKRTKKKKEKKEKTIQTLKNHAKQNNECV
jgi:hypothetical protein